METPHHSPHHLIEMMFYILVFFGIAGIAVPLLQRLRMSPVLGYLLCGILIGPFSLGALGAYYPWLSAITITDIETVQILGELGIIALMFMIGLELSLHRLRELKRYIFGLGSLQITLTAIAIFLIALAFNNPPKAAILIGASLALSSTAIVMKLLEEQHLSNKAVGILCFAILLMQDLAVVPILVLTTAFSGGGTTSIPQALVESLIIGTITVAVMYLIGKRILTPLLRSVSISRNPEWLAAFAVFTVVACAMITNMAGLSLALGAFMAGILIAETEFKHEVEVIIAPIKSMLLGIFFLSVGMMINVEEVLRHPVLLGVSVLGIYTLKALILFPLCLMFNVPGRRAAEASIYLAQPGEFALMILGVAMATHIMPANDVQFFLLVTTISMMFTPLIFKCAPLATRLVGRHMMKGQINDTSLPQNLSATVLIAGFGRVGQLLGSALEAEKINYTAFDADAERVRHFRAMGFPVIFGDARKKELWRHLMHEKVSAAVIAIDDHDYTCGILHALRAEYPLLPVIVRAKDTKDIHVLYDLGASHVVAETQESSLRIAELLMGKLGTDPETLSGIIGKLRTAENA